MTDVLLVSGRVVGAHPDKHQHGVSIQSPINLDEKITSHILLLKNGCNLGLGESFCIFTFFLYPDSGLWLLNRFDFYFDLF